MTISLRPAWRAQIGWITVAVAIVLVTFIWGGVAQEEARGLITQSGFFYAAIPLLVILYRRFANKFTADERVEHRKGIIARKVNSIRVKDIRNINLEQGIIARLLNFGNLEFSTAGGGGIEVKWWGVRNPMQVKRDIEAHMGESDS